MPTAHLNRRWISKFLVGEIVLVKSALIHSILHKTGTITSGFEGKKRKYHLLKNRTILWYALSRAVHKNRTSQVRFSPSKPDLIRPKNTYLIVIGFLQAFIEPWEPNDRLHGIPGHDPARESRKGVKIHAERTAPTRYCSCPHLWPPVGNVRSCFLHWGQFPERNSAGKNGTFKKFNRMNQKTFPKKSAGRPKFCYKEMELPIE